MFIDTNKLTFSQSRILQQKGLNVHIILVEDDDYQDDVYTVFWADNVEELRKLLITIFEDTCVVITSKEFDGYKIEFVEPYL